MVGVESPKRFHSETSGLDQSLCELLVISIYCSGGTLKVYFGLTVSGVEGNSQHSNIPPTFPYGGRTHTMVTVQDGGGKFLSHISWEWKKFVLSASSPPSSSQWHWKGEEKITEHRLRERRKGFRWKNSWCSPTCSPVLALVLSAEGLEGFCLISASELDVLEVTWQSYWCGQCLSVTVFLEATEKQQ